MFTVTIILVFVLLVLIFVVNFVLTNLAMFQTPFDIVISVPFFKWSHTWQGVEFMYIIAGSVFLGAIVIALSTWVLDTRRKLKLRGLRKELKRLKQELQDVKASFPEEIREEEEKKEEVAPPSETPENMDASSATPEDVTRAFENVVQDGEFLRKKQEDQDRLKIDSPDNNPDQKNHEAADVDAAQQLLEDTPIEAELIDSENSVQEKGSSPKEAEKH